MGAGLLECKNDLLHYRLLGVLVKPNQQNQDSAEQKERTITTTRSPTYDLCKVGNGALHLISLVLACSIGYCYIQSSSSKPVQYTVRYAALVVACWAERLGPSGMAYHIDWDVWALMFAP